MLRRIAEKIEPDRHARPGAVKLAGDRNIPFSKDDATADVLRKEIIRSNAALIETECV
jgi:hypothetical protein